MPLPNRQFSITDVNDSDQKVWDLGNENLSFGQLILFASDSFEHGDPALTTLIDELDELDAGEYHYRIGNRFRFERTA